MRIHYLKRLVTTLWLGGGLCTIESSCAIIDLSGQSTSPINNEELTQYKVASRRCFRTGGTRVVKIHGILRCF